MSPNEYKAMMKDFDAAIKKRCSEEGIFFEKLQAKHLPPQLNHPNLHHYQLNNEVYTVLHDGNQPQWQFMGHFAH